MKICASMRAAFGERSAGWRGRPLLSQGQAFEVPERLLDADKLEVQAPQPRRIVVGEIGAQEIPALAPPDAAQLRAIEAIAECGAVRSDLDCDETPSRPGLLARGTEPHQKRFATELHAGQLLEPSP